MDQAQKVSGPKEQSSLGLAARYSALKCQIIIIIIITIITIIMRIMIIMIIIIIIINDLNRSINDNN